MNIKYEVYEIDKNGKYNFLEYTDNRIAALDIVNSYNKTNGGHAGVTEWRYDENGKPKLGICSLAYLLKRDIEENK